MNAISAALVLGLLSATATASSLLAAPREPAPDQLPQFLQRFPDADADKDGRLTIEEARNFLAGKKSAKQGNAQTAGDGTTAEGLAKETKPAKRSAKAQWVWSAPKEPAGCKFKTFHSALIKQEVSYLIWLPPGYDREDSQTRHPVIYLLHGGGGNYQHIPEALLPQLAGAISAQRMPPVIAVVVNGLAGSLYVDSADGTTPVESIILKELIPHIDATYRTDLKRRALEGFSMGGYGATHLAFKYPESFIGVADFAGAVQSWDFFGRVPNISQTWGSEERFLAEWPMTLARKNAGPIRDHLRQVFIAVGDRDTSRGNTLESNTKLHHLLDELKVSNQFTVVPGVKHSYQNLCQDASIVERHIQFYADLFGKK